MQCRRCERRRREQAQGGDFMSVNGSQLENQLAEKLKAAESHRSSHHWKHLPYKAKASQVETRTR